MGKSEITVWGAASMRAIRVHWALHELGLDYRTEPIGSRTGETDSAAYGRLNPKRKIPFLEDGDFGLSESAAIVHYLFRAYGAGTSVYLPGTDQEKAVSDEWCYFVMTELDAQSLSIVRRHEGLPDIYGDAPAAVASAKEYFLKQLKAVTPRIASADPYLFGDRIAAADILLTTCLDWADVFGIALGDACRAYRVRTTARPAYATARQANAAPGAD